jgi:hypothetical protein
MNNKTNSKERLFEIFGKVNKLSGNNLNEWFGQQFVTGHKDNDAKNVAKIDILNNINDRFSKIAGNESAYAKGAGSEESKQKITQSAEADNWRGKVITQKSPSNGLYYIVYLPKKSGLGDISAAAGGSSNGYF